jgi:peptidoglycan/xylan/chitin deacetylase (PgdA/CDA1 family)
MHSKSITAKALPEIITYLIQNGFTIKTFDEYDTPVNFYHDAR